MTIADNKIEWKDRLQAAIDYLRYAKIIFYDGQIVFSGLVVCKAYELLSNDEDDEKRKLSGNNCFKPQKRQEKRNIFKEKMDGIIPKIWEKQEDQEEAKKIFIRENKEESIENYPNIIRNRIIHRYYKADENLKRDTETLINRLFELPVIRDYKEINDRNYEERRDLEHKLGIINPDDVTLTIKKKAAQIKQEYLENLILSRKELIPELLTHLKHEIQNLPQKNRFFTDYISADHINISTVESTSSYIWLTIKPKNLLDRLSPEYRVRSQIYVPSFSLVIMPFRIWTYIELAGMNYWHKLRYYDLIFNKTEKFYDFIRELKDFDDSYSKCNIFPQNKPCLIDAVWYVFEIKEISLSDLMDKQIFYEYIEAQKAFLKDGRLKDLTEKIRKQIPITWNIALPGCYDSYDNFKEPVSIKKYSKLIVRRWLSLYKLMTYISHENSILPPFNAKYIKEIKKSEEKLVDILGKENDMAYFKKKSKSCPMNVSEMFF